MTDIALDYDLLVQMALRGVVRDVLTMVEQSGLPGNHHFYLAFKTQHPGVEVPDHLRERYSEEITIVLQYQFWDLKVAEDYFEVCLSFNKRPERLVVPFEALTGFMDPSVQFGLQLQPDSSPFGQKERGTLAPTEETGPAPAPTTSQEADQQPEAEAALPTGSDGESNVVPLDSFRKKSKNESA